MTSVRQLNNKPVKDVNEIAKKIKLVIFDKDGTLTQYGTGWDMMGVSTRMEKEANIPGLGEKILHAWGYNPETKTWHDGIWNASPSEIIHQMTEFLKSHGVGAKLAKEIAENFYTADTFDPTLIDAIDDPVEIMKKLKENGIKIAICTNDSEGPTDLALTTIKVKSFVDLILCGEDANAKAKPDPHNINFICEKLGVKVEDTLLIGDSARDVEMGARANVGVNVGVLSGLATEEDLHHADVILKSVKDIMPMIFPETKGLETNSNRRRRIGGLPGSKEYDYIIVGAGSAGCVLANRLSADPDNRVLLLESGPEDKSWIFHMPAALMYTLTNPKYNWCYFTTPQQHMNNRRMYWPRGRVLGGSSSHNAMVYIRGHAYDYDRWESEGATGWSYADCLPYFRKSETYDQGENDYRGANGFLNVTQGKGENPLFKAFIEAGIQAGYPYTADCNGRQQEGFGPYDMTIHNGKRASTSVSYLRPVTYRKNLTTQTGVLTRRVLFDGQRANGVEFKQGGEVKHAFAEKEVILSSGAINSPQLLMLSGVGPAQHLRSHDIDVRVDLPGVGQNLQDHLEVYVQQKCTQPLSLYEHQWRFPLTMVKTGLEWFLNSTGAAATAHLEAGAFIRSRPEIEHPDIQFHFLPSVVINHGQEMGSCHAFQVHVGPMRSTSQGFIQLKSKNPEEEPLIEPNYMSTEHDVVEFRDCIRTARDVFAQKAFEPYRGGEIQPGIDVQSDKEIDAFVRAQADTAYHPSCTCKIGQDNDKMAVVDPTCRVYGVDGLRVVDASVMPSVVSGNLNGPTVMIAEKAADMILGKPALEKADVIVSQPKGAVPNRKSA